MRADGDATACATLPDAAATQRSAADRDALRPRRLPELVMRRLGADGQHVIKDPRAGKYFNVGAQEYFLLEQFDGRRTVDEICAAFTAEFGEPLTGDELRDFVAMANRRGLLASEATDHPANGKTAATSKRRQSILYCRLSLFDPDRFLRWLAPKSGWLFTKAFFVFSLGLIALAAIVAWTNRWEFISAFPDQISFRTVLMVWSTVIVVTMLHEFAHGLACRHFGGEVHEIGVLMMFFTPCLYCNVSDAWLFPEKWKRLCVGLAGTYCDLCVWALATLVWRLTLEDTLSNYMAWTVVSVCSARVFFNFNPLMKLDGYYLLSDALGIPNLSRRGEAARLAWTQRTLWGTPVPADVPRSRLVFWYGVASWTFSLIFLGMMFLGLLHFQGRRLGWFGAALSVVLFVVVVRNLFSGIFTSEVTKMLTLRRKRTVLWAMGLAALPTTLYLGHMEDRVGGAFLVRPAVRAEVRATVAGFLQESLVDEGQQISAGQVVARLSTAELESNIATKRAQIRESQANLRRLEAGPRPEEVAEQRARVARSANWRDLAKQDLARAQTGLREDLARIDLQIAQHKAENDFAEHTLSEGEKLYQRGAYAGEQLRSEKKRLQIAQSQLLQAQAQRRAREATGTLDAEAELARREKELADARAALALLEAGSREEDIEAERARLARLEEELRLFVGQRAQLELRSPVPGIVTTPRMKEKIGQFIDKGALVCVVDDNSRFEAEITLAEEDREGVRPNQKVELKARALPFQVFRAHVERIAASATASTSHSAQTHLTVYCRLDDADANLLSGMTGYGRISRGSQSTIAVLWTRMLRYLRTEFWW